MGVIGYQGSLQRRPVSFIVCSADVYRGKKRKEKERKGKERKRKGKV